MRYEVFLTEDAKRDLDELHDYILSHDGIGRADVVLGHLEEVVRGLSQSPERGSHPKELLKLGIREYRQVFFKPYRIIYRVTGRRVHVYVMVDGRRELSAVLGRRLLWG